MKLIGDELVSTVVEKLNTERSIMEEHIKDKEGLLCVLGTIIELAGQLKESKKLDDVVEKKRKVLSEIEQQLNTRSKEIKEQESATNDNITELNKIYYETAKKFKKKSKEGEAYYKVETEKAWKESDIKIQEYKRQELEAKAGKDKAVTERDEMESKNRAFKEEMIAKL
jgi:hypothetical protein